MAESIHEPLHRGAVAREFGGLFVRLYRSDRIEQHRGRARELDIGFECAALDLDAEDLGRNEEGGAAGTFDVAFQLVDRRLVTARRKADRDLRMEARRAGNDGVSTGKFWWSQYLLIKKNL